MTFSLPKKPINGGTPARLNIRNIIMSGKPRAASIQTLEVGDVFRVIATATEQNHDAEGAGRGTM